MSSQTSDVRESTNNIIVKYGLSGLRYFIDNLIQLPKTSIS